MITVSKHIRPIGYSALIKLLKLKVLPHFRYSYISSKGGKRIIKIDDREQHIYPKSYALHNEKDPILQVEFAIRYDGINLEILKQVFLKLKICDIEHYIQSKPTSKYARKIWFLYEFLLNKKLNIIDAKQGQYVDLLNAEKYYTCTAIKSQRHRVNNNLLGLPSFCPLVRKTAELVAFEKTGLDKVAKNLIAQYDPLVITRAIYYLYTKETMSSYAIEKERPNKQRLVRFINLLKQVINIDSINKEILIKLQNNIVDPRFIDVDYRHNQNYVGEQLNYYRQIIHYISPQPKDVPLLMQGLLACLDRMFLCTTIHPVITAAVISFGMVFIHPFEDGNGRLHRFLIHYILTRLGFTPRNAIFPISAVMLKNIKAYDDILESFSRPLLTELTKYNLNPEGVLKVNQDSLSFYQYIDYTKIVEYLFACIKITINTDFKEELDYIANYDKTKQAIQDIIDMPDKEIDRIIKFIMQNNGKLSDTKQKTYFSLLKAQEIVAIEDIVKDFML